MRASGLRQSQVFSDRYQAVDEAGTGDPLRVGEKDGPV
jgi:hypothetical protein